MKFWIVCLSLLFLSTTMLVSSRTMWGVRKKQKEEDLEDRLSEVLKKAERPKKMEKAASQSRSRHQKASSSLDADASNLFGGAGSPTEVLSMYSMLLDKFEELITSDQFDQYFDKDLVEEAIRKASSSTGANELVQEVLDNVDLNDASKVKETITNGITVLRQFLQEAIDAVSDPQKLAELLDQLPEEMKGLVQALMSGNVQTIRNLIQSLDGIDPQQKQMVLDLLDGKFENILKQSQETLLQQAKKLGADPTDPSAVDPMELARKNLLSNPEIAAASGIPLETLNDPDLFAKFMEESMSALFGGAGGDGSGVDLSSLFASLGGGEGEEADEVTVEEVVEPEMPKLKKRRQQQQQQQQQQPKRKVKRGMEL